MQGNCSCARFVGLVSKSVASYRRNVVSLMSVCSVRTTRRESAKTPAYVQPHAPFSDSEPHLTVIGDAIDAITPFYIMRYPYPPEESLSCDGPILAGQADT